MISTEATFNTDLMIHTITCYLKKFLKCAAFSSNVHTFSIGITQALGFLEHCQSGKQNIKTY